ncbi:guanosine polyphosphate pyrophosphohydrolase [Embleya scabrispora]|uniref:Guanosine polyphosphate pyrophosphohydrolase n=1 Tax=Embleya scabrispora TaxID=159449 RepID=A0A1T3NTJ0_9ACTN|nr:guanosine polyphosphate pyrophosphohydrolase [Embleya scabrispora]OPC80098.1 guanosine polyphosphate pyrophosphohydrolase [Embleya scabrispora]
MSLGLIVVYTSRLDACREFYASLGLVLVRERHGSGPEHYAATLDDGTVVELYPARPDRLTGYLRLGLVLVDSPLPRGRHLLTDPDGRSVDVRVG